VRKFSDIFVLCQGRVSRKTYWLCGLLPAIVLSVISWRLAPPLWLLLTMLAIAGYIGLMLSIKRSHDLGRRGFFVVLLLVPLVNLWLLALFAFQEGTAGGNRYGLPDERFPNVLVDE